MNYSKRCSGSATFNVSGFDMWEEASMVELNCHMERTEEMHMSRLMRDHFTTLQCFKKCFRSKFTVKLITFCVRPPNATSSMCRNSLEPVLRYSIARLTRWLSLSWVCVSGALSTFKNNTSAWARKSTIDIACDRAVINSFRHHVLHLNIEQRDSFIMRGNISNHDKIKCCCISLNRKPP